MSDKPPDAPLIVRAKKDEAKDRSIAEEAREQADIETLHALCLRLITERKQLADAFNAMLMGWVLLQDERPAVAATPADKEVIASIERVAHEAIAFAREVVQALTQRAK